MFDFLFVFYPILYSFANIYSFTVKPVRVKIVSPNEILTAGVKSPLRCEAWGSAPPGLFSICTNSLLIVTLMGFFWDFILFYSQRKYHGTWMEFQSSIPTLHHTVIQAKR